MYYTNGSLDQERDILETVAEYDSWCAGCLDERLAGADMFGRF